MQLHLFVTEPCCGCHLRLCLLKRGCYIRCLFCLVTLFFSLHPSLLSFLPSAGRSPPCTAAAVVAAGSSAAVSRSRAAVERRACRPCSRGSQSSSSAAAAAGQSCSSTSPVSSQAWTSSASTFVTAYPAHCPGTVSTAVVGFQESTGHKNIPG